jgi:transposase InsO family protein
VHPCRNSDNAACLARVKQAGLLSRWKSKPSRTGTGFEQPLQPHQHWHIDISYIDLSGTFYYLCSILDGFSRFLVHRDLRESMRETDVEVILQRATEKYLEAKPRINNVRLNSAIGYITPKDTLAGHQQEIQAERDRKLDAAKEQRKNRHQGAR